MDRRRMMFGEVVGEIVRAAAPVDLEFAIADAVAFPVETHVYCHGTILLDGTVGNTSGTCIVGLNGCRLLGMAEIGQSSSKHGNWDTHVFITGENRVQVVILNVGSGIHSARSGVDTVQMAFDGGSLNNGCTDIAWIINFVTSSSKTDSIVFRSVWLVGCDDA